MTSRVNWTLLGAIIERQSYGLELAQRTQRKCEGVLSITDSQAYTALDALQARGLIEIVSAGENPRQPKLVYRATPLGIAAYQDRLVSQATDACRVLELWVRQLGIFAKDPETALSLLSRFEAEYRRHGAKAAEVQAGDLVAELSAEQIRLITGVMFSFLEFARERFESQCSAG